MNILERIMNDQSSNSTEAIPKNNQLDEINNILSNLQPINNDNNNNSLEKNNTFNENDLSKESIQIVTNPNTYENILTEIQEHEIGMEQAIKEADELAIATKKGVMEVLKISNNRRHGILLQGVPDAINATAKLLDLSINGRHKLANMKKLRASIIKDMTTANGKSNEFDLMSILNED